MTITEIKQALGSWTIQLDESTPKSVLDSLTYFGHIAVLPGTLEPSQYNDALLTSARYVGVYRNRSSSNKFVLKGSGMAFWLGDEDDKGDVFETVKSFTGTTFANTIRDLLPGGGAITEGNIFSVAGTYTGTHQWVTPRSALTYVTDLFGAEWRVNSNGTLDAGPLSSLYVTTPKTVVLRRSYGVDLQRKAIPGDMSMDVDVEEMTTRVVLLAEGEGSSISTGSANAPATTYKDLHGNPIKMTRLISESSTESGNAAARAQLQLNRFVNARRAVDLSTSVYDIKGDFVVGDYLDVYDPDAGFIDTTREIYWQGQPINPMALRCVEMTWPIPAGWTVAFRDINGKWIDLSQYYQPEDGDTTIVVGDLPRGLGQIGSEAVGVRPNLPDTPGGADSTIPNSPTFVDFSTGSYQPNDGAWTKSAIFVSWSQPLNIDGSVITDGDHYELRYRVNTYIGYQVKWGTLNTAGYKWGALNTNKWGAPISDPVETSQEWHVVYVGWDQIQTMVQELTPGVEYEFQIRAVDSATPAAHEGPWSASTFIIASGDLFAPDTPAAPVVFSSRIAIQVVHTLGKASGGTYNLQPDLVYLSVHVGGSTSFLPDESNMVGKLIANSGMLSAHIPAIGTFQIEQTDDVWIKVIAVDRAGNKSSGSDAIQASADLIDNQHISDLSVSKLTAGIITAQSVLASQMEVGAGGNIKLTEGSLDVFSNTGEKMIEAGLLSNGKYGLAAVDTATGALTDLATLAFGIRANNVTSSATLTGTGTMRDIPGSYGPEVFVTIGDTGRCLVTASAYIKASASANLAVSTGSGSAGYIMTEVATGIIKVSAAVSRAATAEISYDKGVALYDTPKMEIRSSATKTTLIENLPPGLYQVTMKYFNLDDGQGVEFSNRTIIVQPF